MITLNSVQLKPVFKLGQPDDSYKFQPLPAPSGKYPYHLYIEKILPDVGNQKISFHTLGDTGSVRDPDTIGIVVNEMIKHYNCDSADQPQFLYHLGDVVYNHGEAERYEQQFFVPYKSYPAPIFAIAGNHDSDINPANPTPYKSLDAFSKVFCDTVLRPVNLGGGTDKMSMIQPNIYWTLKTPLFNMIGLHSNVPKFGIITPEQRAWFVEELKTNNNERPEKALIVCLHHSPYSADINHGSSLPMIEFLEGAFKETGIIPDLVLSGHVHNYQRFNKDYDNKSLTYVVAGAGGFDELHAVVQPNDEHFTDDDQLFNDVKLMKYCDNKHGFLNISVEKNANGLIITGSYYSITKKQQTDHIDVSTTLYDQFVIHINA
ncbi:metallophosphoesterase family protein [Mucilaginibacter aquaedulcis]|uniref:metallophosphoesterase family protein n=1 Tax=Mucilaginibacter aquaedulcis TaxID=1187081 RepID=UPI0025B3FA42|nr:metallophosphoesterase [Mucilaginibacter aquaedulcis]MDN3548162.1 metallophosphoesterase [Mucilaginibacter aquaedulcis]